MRKLKVRGNEEHHMASESVLSQSSSSVHSTLELVFPHYMTLEPPASRVIRKYS